MRRLHLTSSLATTLEYDGTSWTSGGDTLWKTGRWGAGGGSGTSNCMRLQFGGYLSLLQEKESNTEGYDGTSWSTRPSMATARRALGGGAGTHCIVYCSGGRFQLLTATEEFTGETVTATPSTLTTS